MTLDEAEREKEKEKSIDHHLPCDEDDEEILISRKSSVEREMCSFDKVVVIVVVRVCFGRLRRELCIADVTRSMIVVVVLIGVVVIVVVDVRKSCIDFDARPREFDATQL